MPFPMTPERFAAIRKAVMERRAESLAAEIAAIDWTKQPHFDNVDEFLKYADTFIKRPETPLRRSPKRRG